MFDLKKFLDDTANNVGKFFNPNQGKPQQKQQRFNTTAQTPAPQQGQRQAVTQKKKKQPNYLADAFNSVGKFTTDVNKNTYGAAQKPVGDIAKGIGGIVTKAANTVQAPVTGLTGAALVGGDKLFNGGKNSQNIIKSTASELDKNIKNSFVTPDVALGKASPVKFGKQFTGAGVDVASLLPAGKVIKGAELASQPLKQAFKSSLINNTKQAGVLGTAFNANDLLQGRQVTPTSVATNYAAPAVLGTGSELGGRFVAKGAQNGLKTAQKANTNLEQINPQVKELDNTYQTMQKQFDNTTDPVARKSYNEGMAQNRQDRIALAQGGYIRLSDGKEVKRVGKDASSYGMSHRPSEDGAPGHDLSNKGEFVPEDIYTNPEYYGGNTPTAREAVNILNSVKGKPDAELTVYRAGPKDELNSSDWITLSKKYAEQESLAEGTPINSFKVKAKELRWPGDSLDEFGFFPEKKTPLFAGKEYNRKAGQGGFAKVPGSGGKNIPDSINIGKNDVFYHGTTAKDAQSLTDNGFNPKLSTKGSSVESPYALFASKDSGSQFGDHSASNYGDGTILEVRPKADANLLDGQSKTWLETMGKSKNAIDSAKWAKELQKRGYDGVQEGNGEVTIFNHDKFDISAPQVGKTVDEGKTFYHGTNNTDLKNLSDLKAGRSIGKSGINMTYITENPEIAKNFGSNVISGKVYGKHLDISKLGNNAWDPIKVPKDFADYTTNKLLSPRDRRVFEQQYLRGQGDNRIIDATPDIQKYLVSKGYSTVTVPRVGSDVNGLRTETVIIDQNALKSAPQVGKGDGQTWYHGTSEGVNFDKFDASKAQIGNRGKQIYLTENQAAADWFSKLKSQSNYLKTDEFRNGTTSKGIGDFTPNTKEFVIPSNAKIKVLGKLPQENAEAIISQLKNEGYDGVRFTDDVLNTIEGQPELAKAFVNGKHPATTIMFNPDKLQTKSQLTDLYNQAKAQEMKSQGGYAKVPFIEPNERPIPKSAQEYAHSSTPDEILKQTVDSSHNYDKQAKGGTIINRGEYNDPYTADGGTVRTSDHTPFYSRYFKENGRKPSKVAYQQEVQRQLDGGGGDLVQKDIADAYQLSKARQTENDAVFGTSAVPQSKPLVTTKLVPQQTEPIVPPVSSQRVNESLSSNPIPVNRQLQAPAPLELSPAQAKQRFKALNNRGQPFTVVNKQKDGQGMTTSPSGTTRVGLGADRIKVVSRGGEKRIVVGGVTLPKDLVGDASKWKDIGSTLKTMDRNIEASAPSEAQYRKIYDFLLAPRGKAVTNMVDEATAIKGELKKAVDQFGLKDKESRADVMKFGEKKIGYDELVAKHGQAQADNIVNADKWFRGQYDRILEETNTVLRKFNQPEIPKRDNYYTHFADDNLFSRFGLKIQQLGQGGDVLQDTGSQAIRGQKIDPKLLGQSEFTVPNKRFNPFAQRRKGDKTEYDAVKAFEKYLMPTLHNKHLTESVVKSRILTKEFQKATEESQNLPKLIRQIQEYGNDLSGKTNRFDRPLLETKGGEKVLKAAQYLQTQMGRNTILGSVRSAIMQTAALPQSVAGAGAKNTSVGLLGELKSAFTNSDPVSKLSPFIRRRYANKDSVLPSKLKTAEKAAAFAFEEIESTSTKAIWRAQHAFAESQGLRGERAIAEADRLTERIVGGRQTGEKAEAFRSITGNTLGQFQLEVNNFAQQVGHDWRKDPKRLAKLFAATYLFNSFIYEPAFGDRPLPDPIQASVDTFNSFAGGDIASGVGRLPGELLSNVAGGQVAAGLLPENGFKVGDLRVPGRKKLLGSTGAGRYGGSVAVQGAIENPLYLIPKTFGLKQAERTIGGLRDLLQGESNTTSGNKRFDIKNDLENQIRAGLFGSYGTKEGKQYIADKNNNLSGVGSNKTKDIGDSNLANSLEAKIKSNKDRSDKFKSSLSKEDYALSQLSKTDQQSLVDNGTITQKKLDGLTNYVNNKKTDLGYNDTKKKSTNKSTYEDYQKKYDKEYSTYSDVQKLKADKELTSLKVKKDFDKDVTDLYGMSKQQAYDFVSKNPDGNKIAEQLVKYGDAQVAAGTAKYNKFRLKSGAVSIQPAAKGGKGGKKGGGKGRKGGKGKKMKYDLSAYTYGLTKDKTLRQLLKKYK